MIEAAVAALPWNKLRPGSALGHAPIPELIRIFRPVEAGGARCDGDKEAKSAANALRFVTSTAHCPTLLALGAWIRAHGHVHYMRLLRLYKHVPVKIR